MKDHGFSDGGISPTMWYKSIISVDFGIAVTSIGVNSVHYCSNLTSVTIPNSVTSIGDGAFKVSGLTSIIIPDSVTFLGQNIFNECTNLITVTIGKGITSFPRRTFRKCSGLTNITIPNNVTSINENVFSGCSNCTIFDFSAAT